MLSGGESVSSWGMLTEIVVYGKKKNYPSKIIKKKNVKTKVSSNQKVSYA
jgi:hypothetical protein